MRSILAAAAILWTFVILYLAHLDSRLRSVEKRK